MPRISGPIPSGTFLLSLLIELCAEQHGVIADYKIDGVWYTTDPKGKPGFLGRVDTRPSSMRYAAAERQAQEVRLA